MDLARIAYEEFSRVLVGNTIADHITPWEQLDPRMRQAWHVAVCAVEAKLAVGMLHGRMQ